MERLGERTRDIRFYSNKNGDIVCLHSKWARNYARWLEEQAWVQSYQVGCPLDADIMDNLPSLRYIGVLATGYNVVDIQAAARHGITVTNIPAYGTDSVAQAVFAHIFNILYDISHYTEQNRRGVWQAKGDFCYWDTPLVELAGKRIGRHISSFA